jgi:tetraacyldisaccharide 4'-kinase
MANWLQKQWLSLTGWHLLLMPISWLFFSIVSLRRFFYNLGWFKSLRLPVPVIIVGNINVGGTGKTPLVIWLVEQLQQAGFKPGVISRGYGGKAETSTSVSAYSDPLQVGDEPVLIAKRSQCPVFIHANRVLAGDALLSAHPECDVIISDDGLQHYRLQRDIEIVVIDGVKGLGNGALLPAGPLRESASRLKRVAAIVVNGTLEMPINNFNVPIFNMQLVADTFYNLQEPSKISSAQAFANQQVLAIAGIGNPNRFFQQLTQMGIHFTSKAYPDHYVFNEADFNATSTDVVLMTEKDAVKCQVFAKPHFWALPVKAVIKNDLMTIILNKLRP